MASKTGGYCVHENVGAFKELLKRLLVDVDGGLLSSVSNQARAETFDDLLDHAAEYLKHKKQEGAGVLSTAVFEDSVRRIARLHNVSDQDTKLDELISSLDKLGTITSVVAKRCRAAAGVRNKSLHAQWGEFSLNDIDAVIVLTRELISNHLAH